MEDKQSFDTLSAYNIENSTIVSEFAAKVLIDQFNKDQHEWIMNATHFYNTVKQHEIFKREEIIKVFNENFATIKTIKEKDFPTTILYFRLINKETFLIVMLLSQDFKVPSNSLLDYLRIIKDTLIPTQTNYCWNSWQLPGGTPTKEQSIKLYNTALELLRSIKETKVFTYLGRG